MQFALTVSEREALESAARHERRVRAWRRYRAVLIAAEEGTAAAARVLGCALSSVYSWVGMWRQEGVNGLRERSRGGGRPVRLAEGAGATTLTTLLREDPQARGWHATGWTVPLLRTELARVGYTAGERTIRRTLHRLGWCWKRPKYVLGRPDPEYAAKKGRLRRGRKRS